jgi:hypothetical protein
MPERHVVDTFVSLVESGRFIEALQRYYHASAVVWENQQRAREGLDALIANEQRVLNAFTAVSGRAMRVVVDGDDVAIQWRFEFSNEAAQVSLEETALQHWSGGKIMHERFFYDPAQLRPQGASPSVDAAPREPVSP